MYQERNIGSVPQLSTPWTTGAECKPRNDRICRVISQREYFTARSGRDILFADFGVGRRDSIDTPARLTRAGGSLNMLHEILIER